MKVDGFLVIALIFITFVFHPQVALATDMVQITGYVYDVEGNPVEGASVDAFSLKPPWTLYGHVETGPEGYFTLSFGRPNRLTSPVEDRHTGFPVHEGCSIYVAHPSDQWMPATDRTVNTEGKSVIEEEFILKPAGVVKLKAYDSTGALIETFQTDNSLDDPFWPVYATDLDWRIVPSQFMDSGVETVSLNTPSVINIPWNVHGFGRVMLRADNGGKGFTIVGQGDAITINLNYELARTEFRLLRESYERYLDEGYIFSELTSRNIQSAQELFQKASLMTNEAQKARFADLCLNTTLWGAESIEVEKAVQDIEKYRKGSATIQFVDENGIPMRDVDVSISQVTHDFLFGACLGYQLDLDAYQLFKKAGMNTGLLSLYWRETEPSLGQYKFPYPLDYVRSLKGMGIRLGVEGLIVFEPSQVWTTGILGLSVDQLKEKVYQHVYRLVSEYSDYVDYWIVVHNTNSAEGSLGFTREQIADIIRTGVAAVKAADPRAQILVYMGNICGWEASCYRDEYTLDPYSYLSHLDGSGVDFDGIALQLTYGSVNEWGGGTEISLMGLQSPYFFRDLASISRILDWYGTLSKPIHITEFNVPGDFRSNLGYWHKRVWDEELKVEWIKNFYTIAFSKLPMKEITYWEAVDRSSTKAKRGLLDLRDFPTESYYALRKLITEDWTTHLSLKTDSNGQVEFRGFAGDYNVTVSTKDFTANFTIHVNERASDMYTINPGEAEAERAIGQAKEAVSKAKAEGRTLNLERAEKLLEDARRALIDENYAQAILLAEEANRAAESAVTWLVIPVIIAFAGSFLTGSVILFRRVRAKRRKETP